MKATEFYGGASPVNVGGVTGIEMPQEMTTAVNPGKRPAHFWLILIGLLVLARIFYESAG